MDFIKEAAHELRMTVAELARKLGVSRASIEYMRKKGIFDPIFCVKIEQATKGKILREHLRPDDYLEIWPELKKRANK